MNTTYNKPQRVPIKKKYNTILNKMSMKTGCICYQILHTIPHSLGNSFPVKCHLNILENL